MKKELKMITFQGNRSFKLILSVSLICLLLIGCTMSDNPKESDTHKEDVTKELVYVDKTDGYDFESIMEEGGFSEEFEMNFRFESEFELPVIDQNKMFDNEKIYVNMDSKDAQIINQKLKEDYLVNEGERTTSKDKILAGELGFGWQSQYLYEMYENDELVSFTVYSSKIIVPGHGSYNLDSYVFRKSDAMLLNQDEVLDSIGTNIERVKEYINEDFTSNKISYYGESTIRNLVDDISDENTLEQNNIYFRIKPEYAFTVSETDVYIVLEMYVGISGTFESPIIYRIPINKL